MLYIPKIDNYLKTLTDEEVKDFAAINFCECFKSTREKMYSKLSEEQNLRKAAKLLYIFVTIPHEVEKYVQSNSFDNCIHRYNVEILNLYDPELQLINTKTVTKNNLKELLNEFKKFKAQTILVLDYKKRNDLKIFHSYTELIASDSEIYKAFISMHQSIMTKIKKYACKDWIVLNVTIKHGIKIFEC